MLMPTAVAAAPIMMALCCLTTASDQKVCAASGSALSSSGTSPPGVVQCPGLGINPFRISPQMTLPSKARKTTTAKKLSTIRPTKTFKKMSNSFPALFPDSLSFKKKNATASMVIETPILERVESPIASPTKFFWRAAKQRLNWGMHQSILAVIVAMSQPQPRAGLICSLIA